MANEIKVNGYVVSKTLAAKVSNAAGEFWHVASGALEISQEFLEKGLAHPGTALY